MHWIALLCFVVVSATTCHAAEAPDLTVPLPPGETALGDIGTYRVAYQSYGGEVVEMPLSWMGHFTTESGISYAPDRHILGRTAILLHSPWRVPPGKVWVDYRLQLPKVTPITLSFGIAMGPDVATPDRSDGVTFSCYLLRGGREEELLRRHHDKGEWQDHRFDLSRHAGETVTLRLQTEPGPNNSPSWDYSFFGDAKITAGAASQGKAALVKRLMATRACQAAMKAGALPLANDPKRGVAPSSLFAGKNGVAKAGETYRFSYEGPDCRVLYTYTPATGTLDDVTAQVDGGRVFRPALGGGITAALKKDGKEELVPARGGKAIRAGLTPAGDALEVLWEYGVQGTPLRVAWRFAIAGKALLVSASAEEPRVSKLSLGDVGLVPLRKPISVPYLNGHAAYLPAENAFVCRYLDWTQSHASACPQGTAEYHAKTDGTRNPLRETGYVAVSPNVGEVLPNIPHPPSPYLELLGPKVMLDVWGHHKGTYQGDAENLRALKDNGVDHLAIISHVWQRYGYDVKLPDHLPADPRYGGDEGMVEFGKAANECGYVWSLHENYIDLYPDAPSYDASARVLLADGKPSPAWFNKGTGVQSYGLKCNRALEYAKQNAPEIHRRFKTNAAYLDVHTCVPPWHQLDHEAGQPMAAMALSKVKHDGELFQYMRDTHKGPLFGEGSNHFYWAGLCDGAEAQVSGGEHHAPFLDFDLLKVHPQMVNHGMGYYERWFARGYDHQWGHDTGTMEQIDKYRAQGLAYGHAGFIGAAQTANVQWVAREHHLMHPVQRLYGAAKAAEVLYEVEGQFVPASIALAVGETRRQRIRYESGLTLWVNWAPQPWKVEGRILPQWGFLALGPQTEVRTALHEGKLADYAECPEYLFVDARTSFHMPYLKGSKEIEPKLRALKHLGGNRIEVTYEWVVNDTLDQDYHCFVHFINEKGGGTDKIEFQHDHTLPKPTSQWRKGETIVDGPYTITVPDGKLDSYDLTIGLFKDARVPLKGLQGGGSRILIGRLQVTRDGDKATWVTLADLGAVAEERAVGRADFSANLNPAGTWVDFGKVATDGSVKIRKEKGRLVLFPYPRDKAFRVALDLKALAPGAPPFPPQLWGGEGGGKLRVQALAALTQADMGAVPHRAEAGRLTFTAGTAGAGRYVVTW